jgi:hypothetical protein
VPSFAVHEVPRSTLAVLAHAVPAAANSDEATMHVARMVFSFRISPLLR